jgi:hypothetical protein
MNGTEDAILAIMQQGGTVFFALAAVCINMFVILYGSKSDWRTTEAGRVLFWFLVTVAVIMDVALVFRFLHVSGAVTTIIRFILFGTLAGVTVRLNTLLLRSQRRDRQAIARREVCNLEQNERPYDPVLNGEGGETK